MYIYVYVYICICIHIHMRICISTHRLTHTHTHTYTHTHTQEKLRMPCAALAQAGRFYSICSGASAEAPHELAAVTSSLVVEYVYIVYSQQKDR